MKKTVLSTISLIILTLTVSAQKNNLIIRSTKITSSQMQKVSKGEKSLYLINVKQLKRGHTYIPLKNNDTLFIEFDKKIRMLTLKNSKGVVKGRLTGNKLVTNFQCEGPFCQCSGDSDCNDMFSTVHCSDAVCIENTGQCFCFRWG